MWEKGKKLDLQCLFYCLNEGSHILFCTGPMNYVGIPTDIESSLRIPDLIQTLHGIKISPSSPMLLCFIVLQ